MRSYPIQVHWIVDRRVPSSSGWNLCRQIKCRKEKEIKRFGFSINWHNLKLFNVSKTTERKINWIQQSGVKPLHSKEFIRSSIEEVIRYWQKQLWTQSLHCANPAPKGNLHTAGDKQESRSKTGGRNTNPTATVVKFIKSNVEFSICLGLGYNGPYMFPSYRTSFLFSHLLLSFGIPFILETVS